MFVDSTTLPAAANPTTDIAAAINRKEYSRRWCTMVLVLCITRGLRDERQFKRDFSQIEYHEILSLWAQLLPELSRSQKRKSKQGLKY